MSDSNILSISPSAKGVACLRSLDVNVSKDYIACHFVDEDGQRISKAWLDIYPGVGRQICIRSRYIEDAVGRYLADRNGQVISLASGLSTYAYRAPWINNVIYSAEVDLPEMTAFKKEMMRRLIDEGAVHNNRMPISNLSIDITDSTLMDQLRADGWDNSKQTLFIIEGVSYYLSHSAILKLINDIANTSKTGSIVIMDYFPEAHSQTDQFKRVMGSIAKDGEMTYFCPSPGQISELFNCYRILSNDPDPMLERKYYANDYCVCNMANMLIAETKS